MYIDKVDVHLLSYIFNEFKKAPVTSKVSKYTQAIRLSLSKPASFLR
jgi:hypothetical protein